MEIMAEGGDVEGATRIALFYPCFYPGPKAMNSPTWTFNISDLTDYGDLSHSFRFDDARLKEEIARYDVARLHRDCSDLATGRFTCAKYPDGNSGCNWNGFQSIFPNILGSRVEETTVEDCLRQFEMPGYYMPLPDLIHALDNKVFLNNDPPQHHAEEFVVYSADQVYFCNQWVTFFVEANNKERVTIPGAGFFIVNVWGPLGLLYTVYTGLDAQYNRIVCSFVAEIPGVYNCVVSLGMDLSRHITGSPLKIAVSRTYSDTEDVAVVIASLDNSFQESPNFQDSKQLNPHFDRAWGIEFDSLTEKIYVVDRFSHKIRVFCKTGLELGTFGAHGSERGQFIRPTAIAIDNVNVRLVISDSGNHRICVYTLNDYRHIRSFGTKGVLNGQFCYPWGVAVSPDGSLIGVADSKNHRLQLFDMNGEFLRKYSLVENYPFDYKHEFDHPHGVCFDLTGNHIYVTDVGTNNVYKFNLELTERITIFQHGKVSAPQGITTDLAGNILICDTGHNCIRIVSPDGLIFYTMFSGGDLDQPLDLAIMRYSQIVFVDNKGNVLVR